MQEKDSKERPQSGIQLVHGLGVPRLCQLSDDQSCCPLSEAELRTALFTTVRFRELSSLRRWACPSRQVHNVRFGRVRLDNKIEWWVLYHD